MRRSKKDKGVGQVTAPEPTAEDVRRGRTIAFDSALITSAQHRVLLAIESGWRRTGLAPSIRELTVDLGFASTNAIMCHLAILGKKGLVTQQEAGKGLVGFGKKFLPTVATGGRTLRTTRLRNGYGQVNGKHGMFVFWEKDFNRRSW